MYTRVFLKMYNRCQLGNPSHQLYNNIYIYRDNDFNYSKPNRNMNLHNYHIELIHKY